MAATNGAHLDRQDSRKHSRYVRRIEPEVRNQNIVTLQLAHLRFTFSIHDIAA